MELEQVRIPHRYIKFELALDQSEVHEKIVEVESEAQFLSADLIDSNHQVAIEFVSRTDYQDLGGPCYGRGCWSTSHTYDFREVAGFVGARVQNQATGVYFGTFYDPLVDPSRFVKWAAQSDSSTSAGDELINCLFIKRVDERRQLATEESKRLLRQQVQDFIEWLKGQGVI